MRLSESHSVAVIKFVIRFVIPNQNHDMDRDDTEVTRASTEKLALDSNLELESKMLDRPAVCQNILFRIRFRFMKNCTRIDSARLTKHFQPAKSGR